MPQHQPRDGEHDSKNYPEALFECGERYAGRIHSKDSRD